MKKRLTTFYILTVVAFLLQYISGDKFDVFMFMLLILFPIVFLVSDIGNIYWMEADAGSSVMINFTVVVLLYFAVIYLCRRGIRNNISKTSFVKSAVCIMILFVFSLYIFMSPRTAFSYITAGIFYSFALLTLFLVVHQLVKGPGTMLQKDES